MTLSACRACGGRTRPWAAKNGVGIAACGTCGSLRADCGPAPAATYDAEYDDGTAIDTAAAGSLEGIVRGAEPLRRTGRWLDVGFGQGALLAAAERHGWRCHGTEVSPAALALGRARGWTVASDAGTDPRFPRSGFDVVSMVELLEHVPQPDEFLSIAARLLRPGGGLFLTTPNARSLNRWVLGASWSAIAPPDHLTVWTAAGLRCALARHGFVAREIRTEGLNPVEIVRRVRRPATAGEPHRQQAGAALNAALTATPARRAMKRAANAVLSVTGLGDTLKAWAVAGGP